MVGTQGRLDQPYLRRYSDGMSAPRNRTLKLDPKEKKALRPSLEYLRKPAPLKYVTNKIICQNMLEAAPLLPAASVDLLFLDPPYNLNKTFSGASFRKRGKEEYSELLERWIIALKHTLKPTASIYICGDWLSSASIYDVASQHFIVRNRITWEREKGRGAKSNWKNCAEDIWFCTVSDDYFFNAEAVKLRRRVLAPYRDAARRPRDWHEAEDGNFRLTSPSNLWTDITVPFWSMPENTEHPTQKPEKLLAKLILASSEEGGMVLDPFLGSGTTAVVAKKLGRHFIGIEQDETYACLALKRLRLAETSQAIQGYEGGVFWERNSGKERKG